MTTSPDSTDLSSVHPHLVRIRAALVIAALLVPITVGACAADGTSQPVDRSQAASETTITTLAGATEPSTTEAVCDPAVKELLDPGSYTHPLANADPVFSTDPPTSGPHQPGPLVSGVLAEALTRPRQVGALEAGGILLQHRDLARHELTALEGLARDGVAVAPNPELPSRVVATAWLNKQTCDGVATETLRSFIDQHLGQGPEH